MSIKFDSAEKVNCLYFLTLFMVVFYSSLNAQKNYKYYNLPLFLINTDGQEINDSNRIVAKLKVINYIEPDDSRDTLFNYNGKISIKIRGNTSKSFKKKQYAFETQDENGDNNNVSLLGLPKENDWIINGPYSDKTLLRNALAYDLARRSGHYAPRTEFFELFLNGDYQGVYVLSEKIKRDKNRVDLQKFEDEDVPGYEETGGYLLRIDRVGSADCRSFKTKHAGVVLFTEYPDCEEITDAQYNYISNFINTFEKALYSGDGSYREYINMRSFVDYMFVNEIAKNIDAYILSTFLWKDANSDELVMGPVWDFNIAFGNADYRDGYGYTLLFAQDKKWWSQLLSDSVFFNYATDRWKLLREDLFSTQSLLYYVDSLQNKMGAAIGRNFQRWDILGHTIWPNYYVGDNYRDEIDYLKNWLIYRTEWLDLYFISEIREKSTDFLVYPNPFHNNFKVFFTLAESKKITIKLYNIYGTYIEVLAEDVLFNEGDNFFVWSNFQRLNLAPAIYYITFESDGELLSKQKIMCID